MTIDEKRRFIKVNVKDAAVGKPLPYPLYDGNRNPLLKRGYVIETVHECEMLIERGLYRNPDERSIPLARPIVEEAPPPSRETHAMFEATRIRIGDLLQMQSSADSPRMRVKLIGFLKNYGLIVTVPESDGGLIMLKDGQSFMVRFFSGKNAYAFTTTVVRQTSMPFPHVHLSYPREMRSMEIRRGTRIDVELIAAITGHGGNEASGKIVNLSTGGAALRSKAPLGGKGDVITVKFKTLTLDMQSYIVLQSIICSIGQDPNDPSMPCIHGIQFVNPDQSTALALMAFVYQRVVDESR